MKNFGDNLFYKIRQKESFLCLGLDPHLQLIPNIFQKKIKVNQIIYSKENLKIVENFCIALLETCIDIVPVIKLQIAFFEQLGPEGMMLFSKLCKMIKKSNTLCIVDAKRGDIGSTNAAYANAFFGRESPFPCDALTINPWLGIDSLKPFLNKVNDTKGLFILLHTSNPGSVEIQEKKLENGLNVYEHLANNLYNLIEENKGNSGLSSIGVVVGATFQKQMASLRKKLASSPFLIPGFGTQGGTIENALSGLLIDNGQKNIFNFGIINSSRGLCFPIKANECKSTKEWQKYIKINLIETNYKLKSKIIK